MLWCGHACNKYPPLLVFVVFFRAASAYQQVDALFNLLLFRFTIWMQRPTPGMHLQVRCGLRLTRYPFFCVVNGQIPKARCKGA